MTSIVISPMRVLLGAALALLIGLFSPVAAFAADAAHGAQIFSANCAACHIGGGNVVNADRTLKQADLDAYLSGYGEGHEAAIAAQVTKGKNAMPSFLGKLSDTDIADVAAYVEQQAGNGWT